MKVPLSPNQPPNQPTNQPVHRRYRWLGCAAWRPCPHQICPLCLAERPAPARSRCRTCSWDAAWNPCTWNWHMSSTYCLAIFHKHTATTSIQAEGDVVSLTFHTTKPAHFKATTAEQHNQFFPGPPSFGRKQYTGTSDQINESCISQSSAVTFFWNQRSFGGQVHNRSYFTFEIT